MTTGTTDQNRAEPREIRSENQQPPPKKRPKLQRNQIQNTKAQQREQWKAEMTSDSGTDNR
jgi:hypothetical protein